MKSLYRQYFYNYQAQTSDSPLAFEVKSAKGVYIIGSDDKEYLDLISGISVSNLGHRPQEVVQAVSSQLQEHTYTMVYGEYIQKPQALLAKTLVEMLSTPKLENVYFTNSGSEANEAAIKLARRYTGRIEILSMKDAYHGSTMGCLSLSGQEEYHKSFGPLLKGFKQIHFNSLSDLKHITSRTAAVIVEPVMAERGVILPTPGYLQALRLKCTKEGALLIFDEIQTGFGRLGSLFGFRKYDVTPDCITIAKAFGSGFPLGALVSSKEILDSFMSNPVLGHITTFGGHPISCVAALAGIELLRKNPQWIISASEKGNFFKQALEGISSAIKEIRQEGLLMSIEFDSYEVNKQIIDGCLKNQILTDWFLFNNKALRIAPPLIISDQQIEEAVKIIKKAINNL